jgi:hypothetical protein
MEFKNVFEALLNAQFAQAELIHRLYNTDVWLDVALHDDWDTDQALELAQNIVEYAQLNNIVLNVSDALDGHCWYVFRKQSSRHSARIIVHLNTKVIPANILEASEG